MTKKTRNNLIGLYTMSCIVYTTYRITRGVVKTL